jgi:hypothetical protein
MYEIQARHRGLELPLKVLLKVKDSSLFFESNFLKMAKINELFFQVYFNQ